MRHILKNWRIVSASLFAFAIVAVAITSSRGVLSPAYVGASEEIALLQAIAVRDSDGDGLLDWEEALYGADIRRTDSFNLGMTDGEAVRRGLVVPKAIADIQVATSAPGEIVNPSLPPAAAEGTLTKAFARNFFALYLAAKEAGGDRALSEQEMALIANEAIMSISSLITAAPNYKTAGEIIISGSGAGALRIYAEQAEAVLIANKNTATKNELSYLKLALENNDTEALSHIASIARGYRNSAVGLAVLTAPQELAETHLLFVNTLMRLAEINADLARVNDDPLAAMLALQQYAEALESLAITFQNIGRVYRNSGVSISEGVPGALFISLSQIVAQMQ